MTIHPRKRRRRGLVDMREENRPTRGTSKISPGGGVSVRVVEDKDGVGGGADAAQDRFNLGVVF